MFSGATRKWWRSRPRRTLSDDIREGLIDAAVRFANNERYSNLGTFEFLVDETHAEQPYVFIETNARLQVEHTVTEEVTGIDLVQTQIRLAAGATLHELGLDDPDIGTPRGHAIRGAGEYGDHRRRWFRAPGGRHIADL